MDAGVATSTDPDVREVGVGDRVCVEPLYWCGTLDRIGGLRWVGPEVISPVTSAMTPTDAARIAGSRVRDLIVVIRCDTRPDAQ